MKCLKRPFERSVSPKLERSAIEETVARDQAPAINQEILAWGAYP